MSIPADWVVVEYGDPHHHDYEIQSDERGAICYIPCAIDAGFNVEHARLIAAAPTLFEAGKALVDAMWPVDSSIWHEKEFEAMKAALRLAGMTGGDK